MYCKANPTQYNIKTTYLLDVLGNNKYTKQELIDAIKKKQGKNSSAEFDFEHDGELWVDQILESLVWGWDIKKENNKFYKIKKNI